MPRTLISSQTTNSLGIDITLSAADQANGMYFSNVGQNLLLIVSAPTNEVVVTIETPLLEDADLAVSDRTYTVNVGDIAMIGPFNSTIYADASNNINVDFDLDTGVVVGLVEVGGLINAA